MRAQDELQQQQREHTSEAVGSLAAVDQACFGSTMPACSFNLLRLHSSAGSTCSRSKPCSR
jgi:hypothetical protein